MNKKSKKAGAVEGAVTAQAGKSVALAVADEGDTQASPCFVVGIGASAGGQEALEHLFTSLPTDCGIAFIVVMHLPPAGPSFLADMLGRYTTMVVVTAEEGMPLVANRVHVIPSGRSLSVNNGLLRLDEPKAPYGAIHPIDHLFHSLANEFGNRAVAVVLSGSGTDGALGVKLVKEAGGVVIVQEAGTAAYPSMPRNAIASGVADLILPAGMIPEKITEIAHGVCDLDSSACRITSLEEDLGAIFDIVKSKTGHDFSAYKRNTVMRRIERRMAVNDAAGLGRYIALLREDGQEAHALCQDILIGVTSFFRDPEAFAVLRRDIIPRLFANRSPDETVRIWHACCASGEEVYSMAMLIREYLDEQGLPTNVLIFATDIDEVAIAQARSGLYADDIEEDVGMERLKRFFVRHDGRWQVKNHLREMIVFAHHSLIKDPPFSRLDLLVCRNFLIYLNQDMQKRLMAMFNQVLNPGKFLFLGGAESVGRNSELFSVIDSKWKIYEQRNVERRPETLFPYTTTARKLPEIGRISRTSEKTVSGTGAFVEKLLMDRYSPPCVVVNEKYEVVHVTTRMKRYLEVPLGEPTRDVLRMAREELRPALRAAIYKVFSDQQKVEFRGVRLADAGEEVTVNVVVEPLAGGVSDGKLAMVLFEQAAAPPLLRAAADENVPDGDNSSREALIRHLEEQLRITHEQFQVTSEQLETSHEGFLSANEELMSINEEFQSVNEELQSTNEELETSKEELQALNEELLTVNTELQGKVEELNKINSDMENLLTSSGIATLFLDRELNIKGFTPAGAVLFNLLPSDIGRTFRHFAGKIDWPTLAQDAETVLAGQAYAEREVSTLDRERSFLKRVLPYRDQEGRIAGIVITFIDITDHQVMEKQNEHLASFPRLNPNPVLEVDFSGKINFCNPAAEKILRDTGLAEQGCEVFLPDDLDSVLKSWDRTHDMSCYREVTVGARVFGETIFLTPRFDVVRIYCLDITERKIAEHALIESEGRVRQKLESILSPEGDIGNLALGDIIDSQSIQELMQDFHKLVPIPMAILDLTGKVLVGVGWQDICTRFHRVHHETSDNCRESDLQLTSGILPGEFKLYRCKNNMWDVATPIMVGGRHVGNFFSGQFFFEDEPLDFELFKSQARRYGFNENEYLDALACVPRLSRDTVASCMEYFIKFADIISKLSYSNIKLARSLAERESLLEALHESEERFRTMFERHRAVMLLIDPDTGAIVDANAAAAEFYGSSRETLSTLAIQNINQMPSDEMASLMREVMLEQRSSFKAPHRLTNGDIRWVEVYSSSLVTRGKTLLFSIIHDVTDRERAEAALRESEQSYRSLVETAPIAIFINRNGRIDFANPAAVRLFGAVSVETVLGRSPYDYVHPDYHAAMAERIEILMQGGTMPQAEVRVVRPDGSERIVDVVASKIVDTSGPALQVVMHDISESKQSVLEREYLIELLSLVNESTSTQELITAATGFFQRYSGCEAVGIRLRDGDDFPYFETNGFSPEFVRLENNLCKRNSSGEVIRDDSGNALLECMCGSVISGCTDPGKPFFTGNGSFWSNGTNDIRLSALPGDQVDSMRNCCNDEGYESVALIPLSLGEERLGLLQLNDRRKGRFSPESITVLERMTDYLTVALAKFRGDEALRESAMRVDLLAATASELLSSDSPQKVVDSLCHKVMTFLGCELFFNFLVDDTMNRLRLNACAGISELDQQRIEWLEYGVAVCGCVARDACRIVVENVAASLDPRTELIKSYGIQAYACHPLIVQDRVLGTLSFGARTKLSFSGDDLALMKAVADQVAIAMERMQHGLALKKSHDELELRVAERTGALDESIEILRNEISHRKVVEASLLRLNRLYSVLGEIDKAIIRASDRDTLFNDFCRIAVDMGGFLLSWVGLLDEASGQVKIVAACGATGYLENLCVTVQEGPEGNGPTGRSIRNGTYHISNDFLQDPDTTTWHERARKYCIRATASVAVKEEGRVIGAFTLYAGEQDFFDAQMEELLVQMGADVSFALDNLAREKRRHATELALREETLERLRVVETLREKEQMLLQQSRLAAMGEMINNIAHQWRQPLNVLGLLVQQMRLFHNIGKFSGEYLDESVKKSMELITHMSQTIDDFRCFFKPDKEKVEFAIHAIITRTLSLVEDSFKHHQISIVFNVEAEPSITGFPNEYSQVLLNIMMNARDVLLERRPPSARITITLGMAGQKSVVTISDNAGGIPEEILDKIFEPYFTTKGPDKGTGVGLFMSKTIIEKNMNGILTARNIPEGAEIRIEV